MHSFSRLLSLTVAAAFGLAGAAPAQEPARAPAAAASVPPPSKTRPRPMTAAEQRDSASVPGELRPSEPVVPQIRVPLGKRQEAPESRAEAQRRTKTEARGGIDDDVARCKAAATAAAREECQARLRKSGKGP
jgi:hypothetical protein